MYFIGIDLGGTQIKGGLFNDELSIIEAKLIDTETHKGPESVINNLFKLINQLVQEKDLTFSDVASVGIGCPGTIDEKKGLVIYSNNLGWSNFDLVNLLKQRLSCPIFIENDANIAALGEYYFGIGKECDSFIALTIGTGVGSGLILGGELYSGKQGAASELGHMVIKQGGELCSCGRKGCFEVHASAVALVRIVNTELAKAGTKKKYLNGKEIFEVINTNDPLVLKAFDIYLDNLACGISNIINILQPDLIAISGGISRQGDVLVQPLKEKVYQQIYDKRQGSTKIEISSLSHEAGIYGAAKFAQTRIKNSFIC